MSMIHSYKLGWGNVPAEVERLAKEAAGPYCVMQDLVEGLPEIPRYKLWYNPDKQQAMLSYPLGTDSDKVASWHIALRQVPGVESLVHGYYAIPSPDEPYLHVKQAIDNRSVFGPIASAMQLKHNDFNKYIGGPTPIASAVASGLLGAGLGYGAGWLGEQFLPEKYFEKGRLRRTGAILGGLTGTLPAAWSYMDNLRQGHGPLDAMTHYNVKQSRFTDLCERMVKVVGVDNLDLDHKWIKYANEASGDFFPNIPVDQFGNVIWNDLRGQGGYTPAPVAAATTGILQAASMSQGGASFVSPMDIARIGMGMGSGYMSGLMVGKTLGALAGLRPEAQQSLQQAGVWAGLLANVVPMAFGS